MPQVKNIKKTLPSKKKSTSENVDTTPKIFDPHDSISDKLDRKSILQDSSIVVPVSNDKITENQKINQNIVNNSNIRDPFDERNNEFTNESTEILHSIEKGNQVFDNLENDFQTILNRLSSDDHLEAFRTEYKKLHTALILSHENELRLIKKCHALNQEIVSNSTKVAMALKISQEDQETISKLKNELKKAWDMVETTVESETQTQIELSRLHRELKSAEEIIERYKSTDSHYGIVDQLKKENNELKETNSKLTERLNGLYSDYDLARDKSIEIENLYNNALRELKSFKTEFQMYRLEQDKKDKHRKGLQDTITEQKSKLTELDSEISLFLEKSISLQHSIDQHKLTIKEKMDIISMKERELATANSEIKKLERAMKKQVEDNATLTAEKRKQQLEFDFLKQENVSLSINLKNVKKEKSKIELEIQKINDLHNSSKDYIKELQHEIETHVNKINEFQRKALADALTIDSLKLKLSKQEESKIALNQQIKEEENNTILAKQHINKLRKHVEEIQENAKSIKEESLHIHKENELTKEQQHKIYYRIKQLEEEVIMLKLEKDVYSKTISDLKHKLALQRAQYEQIRGDRAAISFKLRQSKDANIDQQQKLSFARQQLDQLKLEVVSHERRITELSKEKENIEKEKTKLAITITEKSSNIANLKSTLQVVQNENENLRQMILNTDLARKLEILKYNEMIRDRDLLGTQVVKRNDHITLLKKKIQIQETIFSQASTQYEKKLKEEQFYQLKIKELESKLSILQRRERNFEVLKEALKVSKENCHEMELKFVALSQQLDRPTNIHMWRITNGKNETKFELMHKTQILQKQLLFKRQELFDLQEELIEKDQLLNQLKKQRKNNPDIEFQLVKYEDKVRKLKDKLRSVTGELNMFEFQSKEKDLQIKQTRVQLAKTTSLLPNGGRNNLQLKRSLRK